MKTKLLAPLFFLLAAACGAEDPNILPENLGTPCDTVLQNGEHVVFCGGVQLNVKNLSHTVKCYLKVEEDGSRTVRCNTGTKMVTLGEGGGRLAALR
jgi:hypothetical protein